MLYFSYAVFKSKERVSDDRSADESDMLKIAFPGGSLVGCEERCEETK